MPSSCVEKLIEIIALLRDSEKGCPWDKVQTSESIAENTLEEAYEVYDAINRKDDNDLKEELGDLLLHVVFHSQIASEKGVFSFEDVAKSECDKMIRRHPHIFGENKQFPDWEEMKKSERKEKNQNHLLDGIAQALPASVRALKMQKRAAKVGFDWDTALKVLEKIEEEIKELRAEILQKEHLAEREEELGDLMFACVNLARKLGISPEKALNKTNRKFERRFGYIEDSLSQSHLNFKDVSLDDMEKLWCEAKEKEHER